MSVADSEQQELILALEAHGKAFLSSFDLPRVKSKKRKRDDDPVSSREKLAGNQEETEVHTSADEEWPGLGQESTSGSGSDSEAGDDFQANDDEFTGYSSSSRAPAVVVFDDARTKSSSSKSGTKADLKAFMSSKVSKLTQDVTGHRKKSSTTAEEENEERTNAENDAELRRLIHTKLLSGSLNPELDMKPAQRRKALEGRLLELAGEVKLGKGEKSVKSAERNKAAQKVRLGMISKQKEREGKQLEEAKNLGNYHPTIKKLFEPESQRNARKREKGLTMGIGKFKGGVLKLRKDDISSIQGQASARPMRGKGRPSGRRK